MDKRIDMAALVGAVGDGMTLAIGGGGLQRKPMAAIRALARTGVSNLHLVEFLGGPDADILLGMGKVAKLSFAFVGFDLLGLAPNFRKLREAGSLPVVEYSEFTAITAFEAAAKRLPFLPTRCGLGTDILDTPTAPFKTFACPITGTTLLAVPAIVPDVAIVHVNEADRSGNGVILGDGYIDTLIARASKKVFLTAERIVDQLPQGTPGRRATFISRLWVEGVCEAPQGARFTGLYPDYTSDVPAALDYQAHAADRAWLEDFVALKAGEQ